MAFADYAGVSAGFRPYIIYALVVLNLLHMLNMAV